MPPKHKKIPIHQNQRRCPSPTDPLIKTSLIQTEHMHDKHREHGEHCNTTNFLDTACKSVRQTEMPAVTISSPKQCFHGCTSGGQGRGELKNNGITLERRIIREPQDHQENTSRTTTEQQGNHSGREGG